MKASDLLGFEKMVSPTLIRVLYWLGLAVIVLSGVGMMFAGGHMGPGMAAGTGGITFGSFVSGALFIVFAGLFWRVVCEIWIVVFGIYDRLGELRDQGKRQGA